jgi:hypothetical protein
MLFRTLLLLACSLLLCSLALAQQQDKPQPAKLEAKLLKAIADGQSSAIEAVGADILRLSEEERRELPFRVRPGAVEFRFRGTCPRHTSVEFLLSNKNRHYESLLVLEKAEFERAEKVWKVAKRAKATRPPLLEFKLLWREKDEARCEDLDDVFRKIKPKERQNSHYRWLEWEDDGLRIPNISVDPAAQPRKAQAAQMLMVLRPGFLSK